MIIILLFSILYIGITLSAICSHDGCVHVKNECPFTLYLQRDYIDGSNINRPDRVTPIYPSSEKVLDVSQWKSSSAGKRLSAWWQNPVGKNLDPMTYREKVEINYGCYGETKMCYNPTAVDYFGLPVKVAPYNRADCPNVDITGQYTINVNDIKYQCPSQYIETSPAGVCRSPYHICLSNPSHTICGALDSGLEKCKRNGQCPQSVTRTNVWGCNGWMASQPEICAALHRGVYGTNNVFNPNSFYQSSTGYNKYSKWIHSNGIKVYGFPYDDVAQQGGYKECSTNFLSVTFCASSFSSDAPESAAAGYSFDYNNDEEMMKMMEMMESDTINPSTPSPIEAEPIYYHDEMMVNDEMMEMMEMMQSDSINNNNNNYDEIQSKDGRCLAVNDKLYYYLFMDECNGEAQQAWSYNKGIIKNEVGYCLNVDRDDYLSKENDVLVVMRPCNEQENQKWHYESNLIISSNGKCLHIDTDTTSHFKLRLWDCDGSDNQLWIMESDSINPSTPSPIEAEPVYYHDEMMGNDEIEQVDYDDDDEEMMEMMEMMQSDSINNSNTDDSIQSFDGKCIDLYIYDQLYKTKCNGEPSQAWSYNNGIIKNENGKCLDVEPTDYSSKRNGGYVRYFKCNGQENQKWHYEFYKIISNNGMCLDIDQVDDEDDILRLSNCNESHNQIWIMG